MDDPRERRSYDGDLARLLRAVFGDGADRGLAARTYDLERDATVRAAEVAQLLESTRESALRWRDFADHPLLNKAMGRRVVKHLEDADRSEKDRGAFFSRIQGQAVILVFSVVQTLVLAWLAVHITGVRMLP